MAEKKKSVDGFCETEELSLGEKEFFSNMILMLCPQVAKFLGVTNEVLAQRPTLVFSFQKRTLISKQTKTGWTISIPMTHNTPLHLLVAIVITVCDDGCANHEAVLGFHTVTEDLIQAMTRDTLAVIEDGIDNVHVSLPIYPAHSVPNIYCYGTPRDCDWALIKFIASEFPATWKCEFID
ncbi:MAG: hypothetical protein AAB575_03865 [Patescibacteria group bacterium]